MTCLINSEMTLRPPHIMPSRRIRTNGTKIKQILTVPKLGLISIFILALSACAESGGGSGSDSGGSTRPPPKPSVTITKENGNIYLDWVNSDANQYRVLYWQGNNAPQEHITSGTQYTFPPLNAGDYTVLVEAYDELGNSLFSAPVTLEVL